MREWYAWGGLKSAHWEVFDPVSIDSSRLTWVGVHSTKRVESTAPRWLSIDRPDALKPCYRT